MSVDCAAHTFVLAPRRKATGSARRQRLAAYDVLHLAPGFTADRGYIWMIGDAHFQA
jgi:hypothetical protein